MAMALTRNSFPSLVFPMVAAASGTSISAPMGLYFEAARLVIPKRIPEDKGAP